jgi:hypothetical protein
MNNNRKIDEEGKLLVSIDSSKFFKLLINNNDKDIKEWLVSNGNIKSYCPIRFISDKNNIE